jgi:hypothetical protein
MARAVGISREMWAGGWTICNLLPDVLATRKE